MIHHLFQPNFLFKIQSVDFVYCPTSLLVFGIPLLYYYINLLLLTFNKNFLPLILSHQ